MYAYNIFIISECFEYYQRLCDNKPQFTRLRRQHNSYFTPVIMGGNNSKARDLTFMV